MSPISSLLDLFQVSGEPITEVGILHQDLEKIKLTDDTDFNSIEVIEDEDVVQEENVKRVEAKRRELKRSDSKRKSRKRGNIKKFLSMINKKIQYEWVEGN